MKTLTKIAVIVLAVAGLAGCLQVDTTVKLNKDGSGTVERLLVMRKDVLDMFAAMQNQSGEEKAESFSLLDREALKKEALEMGPGVSLASAESYKNKVGEGYKAVFAFSDINKLRINPQPDLPFATGPEGASTDPTELVTFEFKKGNPLTLLVRLPAQDAEEDSAVEEEEEQEEPDEEDFEEITQFYQDLRISLRLAINGTITETDADYREGSSVILTDMDFNMLLSDKEAMKTLRRGEGPTAAQMRDLQEGGQGLRMESKEEVVIRFR